MGDNNDDPPPRAKGGVPPHATAVSNPYAKKRNPTGSGTTTTTTSATASATSAWGRNGPSAGDNNGDPSGDATHFGNPRYGSGGGSSDSDHHLLLPAGRPVTFSQAFPSLDGTAAFTAADGPVSEQERAERRAINYQTLAVPGTGGSGSGSDVRDFHMQLQPHVLYVSTRQRGNALLKHIRNVPFAFSEMLPDYIAGPTTCALFLSLKYHQLYPTYIHRRLAELRGDFRVRVLLVLVDVDDNATALLQLNKLGVTSGVTLVLAWSDSEAARYLESLKALEGKDATSIQRREASTVADRMADVITACRPCTKTDAAVLWQHFGSLAAVADKAATTRDELSLCPGLGPVKVQRLWDALHKPFSKRASRLRKRKKMQQEQQEEQQQDEEYAASQRGKSVEPSKGGEFQQGHEINEASKNNGQGGDVKETM